MRLAAVILWRIADGPISYAGLVRLINHKYPRIMTDAIDVALGQLSRLKFIECRKGKWRISHEAG